MFIIREDHVATNKPEMTLIGAPLCVPLTCLPPFGENSMKLNGKSQTLTRIPLPEEAEQQ